MFNISQTTPLDIDFIPRLYLVLYKLKLSLSLFLSEKLIISLFLLHYEPPTLCKFPLHRDKPLTATTFCDTIFYRDIFESRWKNRGDATCPLQTFTSNQRWNGTIHQLTHPLLRKLQVRILSIYKLSINIYTIMYRVLYN